MEIFSIMRLQFQTVLKKTSLLAATDNVRSGESRFHRKHMIVIFQRLLTVLIIVVGLKSQALRANEINYRQELWDETTQLLTRRDYLALEKLYAKYQDSSERTPSGAWKLYFFNWALNSFITQNALLPPNPADPKAQDFAAQGFFANWWTASPHSELRNLMLGKLAMHQVHLVRQGRYHKQLSVEEQAREVMYLTRAGALLQGAASQSKASVLSSREYMGYIGWRHGYGDVYRKEMATVLKANPAYHDFYFSSTPFILPQWTGQSKDKTKELLEEFVEEAVKRNQNGEGGALYARIYWNHNQLITNGRLFEETNASWPKMKQGFEKLIETFPSPHNLSAFAYFACLSNDIESFKRLYSEREAGAGLTGWDKSASGLSPQVFEANCRERASPRSSAIETKTLEAGLRSENN
jgi:hypothetical protein